MRIAFIVNPIAGIGGPAGLAGSDGQQIQELAKQRGSHSHASARADKFLNLLQTGSTSIAVTGPGQMGFEQARSATWAPTHVVELGSKSTHEGELLQDSVTLGHDRATTAQDTQTVVRRAAQQDVDLIVFVGGDGTARDVVEAMGEKTNIPILGIPAGVKMHSSVFALSPAIAAKLVNTWKPEEGTDQAEIADIDEEERRQDRVVATLFARCLVPRRRAALQGGKIGSPSREGGSAESLARALASELDPNAAWVFGPGSTMATIGRYLGYETSLLGVDVHLPRAQASGRTSHTKVSARELEQLTTGFRTQISLSPIGGQGFLLGRGNQQISSELLKRVSKDDLFVVATQEKIAKLEGAPLLMDTGDDRTEERLCGQTRVITGPNDYSIVRTQPATTML